LPKRWVLTQFVIASAVLSIYSTLSARCSFGAKTDAYNNSMSELADEGEFMREWRRDSPLGVLLGVVNYIKTP
jgi:hypothetical protein